MLANLTVTDYGFSSGFIVIPQLDTTQTGGYESAWPIRTLLRLRVSMPRWLELPIIRVNETLLSYL
ncbi:MAG: hypothetical protein VCE75_00345, partial [Alphaproteobacteria bacterium]